MKIKWNVNFIYKPAPPFPYFSEKFDKSVCLQRCKETGDTHAAGMFGQKG